MKKIISLLLIVAMLLTALPAMAENVRTSGPYTYAIKGNGTITITDFDWNANGDADVYVPNWLDGYMVTEIGDGAFAYSRNNANEGTMAITDSILSNLDFYVNPNSVTVTIPDTVKIIGDKAFWMSNISAVNIPDSVERIGSGAFFGSFGCLFKISQKQPKFAVIDNGLYNKTKKELIAYSHFLEKDNGTVSIPNGIVSIGDYVFACFGNDADGLPSYLNLSLPSTVTKAGSYSFAGICFSGLFSWSEKQLSFPFREIEDYAFYASTFEKLTVVFQSLENVGVHAFDSVHLDSSSMEFLKGISFVPEGVFHNTRRKDGSFYRPLTSSNAYSLSIDTTQISYIGENNESLGVKFETIEDFSASLTVIPTGLNPQCSELPSTIITIQTGAFTDVVTDFKIPASVEEIAIDAFVQNSTFIVEADSYAELWCDENGFGYSIEGQDNFDWLNN